MTYKPLIPEDDFKGSSFEEGIFTVNPINMASKDNRDLLEDFQTSEHNPKKDTNYQTCFDIENLPKTKTLDGLLADLCELMIRFDGPVSTYRKGDYEHLIKTLTNSTIQLYSEGIAGVDAGNAAHFIGLANLNTDPHREKITNGHKFPGIYLLNKIGEYTLFNLEVSKDNMNNSIIFAIPIISDSEFVEYTIVSYDLSLTLSDYAKSGGSTKTVQELEDAVNSLISLVPHPVYLEPAINLNIPNYLLEIGASNVRAINSLFTQNDAGPVISSEILRNGQKVSDTSSYQEVGKVPKGTTVYRAETSYLAGNVKNNEIGSPDPLGRIEAGVIGVERTITGILPYYWGVFETLPNLNTLNTANFTKVIANSSGNISIPVTMTKKHLVILIPKDSTIKTKWEITLLNSGSVGVGNLILTPQLKTLSSHQGFWDFESYNVYATAYVTSISPKIELKNN